MVEGSALVNSWQFKTFGDCLGMYHMLHCEPGFRAKTSFNPIRWTLEESVVGFNPSNLAGTIQLKRKRTIWSDCFCENKQVCRASTGGEPNGAAAN
jgi:hypothetical protein